VSTWTRGELHGRPHAAAAGSSLPVNLAHTLIAPSSRRFVQVPPCPPSDLGAYPHYSTRRPSAGTNPPTASSRQRRADHRTGPNRPDRRTDGRPARLGPPLRRRCFFMSVPAVPAPMRRVARALHIGPALVTLCPGRPHDVPIIGKAFRRRVTCPHAYSRRTRPVQGVARNTIGHGLYQWDAGGPPGPVHARRTGAACDAAPL